MNTTSADKSIVNSLPNGFRIKIEGIVFVPGGKQQSFIIPLMHKKQFPFSFR
jgi:hypothetical protein